MSYTAIDSARNTATVNDTAEQLSVFLSEIGASEPVDNKFTKNPTVDILLKNKRTMSGGKQVQYPIDSGTNSTIKWFDDLDAFDTNRQDTARTVLYPMKNIGGTIVVSWEELRETSGDKHRVFDLVKYRRRNAHDTMYDTLNSAFHTQATKGVNTLPAIIDSTGSIGGQSPTDDPDWAAVENAATGTIASGTGIVNLNNTFNSLFLNKAMTDAHLTTQAIYEQYEAYMDADVRYAETNKAVNRGFKSLEYKGTPVVFDTDCASGIWYMIDSETLFLCMDSEANFKEGKFKESYNQLAFLANIYSRLQVVCTSRYRQGKVTGLS